MGRHLQATRLSLDSARTVEALDYVAQLWPSVTQYYLCKVMYFADKEHCLDWGRTITGDRYVAMDHGPVPSRVYEMLKPASGEEDELLDMVHKRLIFEINGNKIHVNSRGANHFPSLSPSDMEALKNAVEFCRPLSFSALREITHKELAWVRAAENNPLSNNPPMDFADWFEAENMDTEQGTLELVQNHRYATR